VILWALPFWLVFVLLLQVGGGERIVRFARRPAWGASLLVAVVLISNLLVDRAGIGGRMEGAFETEKGSVRSRKIIWAGTSKMLVAKPVFGWGIGTFGIYFPRFRDPVTAGKIMPNTIHAHSEYLEVGAEMGVFGLALFLWMLGAFAWDGVRRVRQARDGLQRMAMVGLLAGCIAILLQAAVSVTTRWVVGRFFLWLAMGLTIAAGRMPSPQHPPRKKGEREKAPEQVVEGFYRIRVRPIRSPALRAVCVLFAVGVAGAAAWWGGRVFASAVLTRRAEGYQMAAETLLEQRRDDAALPDALRARELFQERAIELYGRAIELNPYNLSAYYKLGHSYNLQGKFRDALRTYRRMQELSPDGSDIHFNLGVVYANMRRWEESRREYETALRMKIGPLTRLGLARAYENLRLPDKAERQYQALLLDYPDNLRGLNALARFYLRKGENAKAMEFYTKAVAIDPQDADARLGRGLIYQKLGDRYKAQGDNERAAAYYKKSVAEQEIAVTNRPDSVPVRAALALVYAEVGQFDKALAELRTADRIRPRDPLVHLNFGKVYRRKGEPEMAVEEFRRAREIDPGGPWGAEARRELEAMGVE
jgi:tetratricopeptide (TPR) repeat protein